MGKLVSADALLNQINSPYTEYPVIIQIRRAIREMIEDAPAVDAEPVRHGHWKYGEEGTYGKPYGHYECSECGERLAHKENYCPHCGAKMEEHSNAQMR